MLWDKENEIIYWYPKIEGIIPTPKTKIIEIKPVWAEDRNSMIISDGEFRLIEEISKEFNFPLFMRGSKTSGKHDWVETCFVRDFKELRRKVIALIEDALLKDISCNQIALREYIEMETGFWAFHGRMPVNPERRYFIKDGKVICHHPYWIEDAIIRPIFSNGEPYFDWLVKLREMNKEYPDEIEYLTSCSKEIAKYFTGSWSIDFCKSKKGWICIDMALAEDSWHPECSEKIKLKVMEVKQEAMQSEARHSSQVLGILPTII